MLVVLLTQTKLEVCFHLPAARSPRLMRQNDNITITLLAMTTENTRSAYNSNYRELSTDHGRIRRYPSRAHEDL